MQRRRAFLPVVFVVAVLAVQHTAPEAARGDDDRAEAPQTCPWFAEDEPHRPADAAATEVRETLTLSVHGMHSPSCAVHVRSTLTALEGVAGATVDRDAATAKVEYDPERVAPEAMVAAMNRAGYRASLPGTDAGRDAGPAAHASTPGTLTPEEIDRVAGFVVSHLLEGGVVPSPEEIETATRVRVPAAALPAVQATVVDRLAADPRGVELLAGSRCSDYGACSLWRNLAGASGEELARYERDRSRDGQSLDEPLPELVAHDLDGREVRSGDLVGRPALVTLLAVHCTHSMDTFPVLQRLHSEYGPRGLQVVGVLVHSGTAEDARSWVPTFEPEYPVWVHESAALGDRIGSRLVPTYLLVDAEGRLRRILVGFKSHEEIAAAVEATLGISAREKGGEAR